MLTVRNDAMDVTLFGYSHGYRLKRRQGCDVIWLLPRLPLETTAWMLSYLAMVMVTVANDVMSVTLFGYSHGYR